MDATEIVPLTKSTVEELLTGREATGTDKSSKGRRTVPRWPFPGTVELWLPNEASVEQLDFATCLDLSSHGLGMLYDDPLPAGLELAVAIHQPEASLHGRAVVRHCTRTDDGYYIGLQFVFDKT